jgi:hypothetical protein
MAASMIGALVNADATRSQAKYQSAMAKINERRAMLQAEDAFQRGEKEAGRYGDKVKQVIGTQRAGYASQGVVVNSGTASAIQAETQAIGQEDIQTIRTNAFREAMGYKSQAEDYALQGRLAKSAAKSSAAQTLLVGGLQSAKEAGKYLGGG